MVRYRVSRNVSVGGGTGLYMAIVVPLFTLAWLMVKYGALLTWWAFYYPLIWLPIQGYNWWQQERQRRIGATPIPQVAPPGYYPPAPGLAPRYWDGQSWQ